MEVTHKKSDMQIFRIELRRVVNPTVNLWPTIDFWLMGLKSF